MLGQLLGESWIGRAQQKTKGRAERQVTPRKVGSIETRIQEVGALVFQHPVIGDHHLGQKERPNIAPGSAAESELVVSRPTEWIKQTADVPVPKHRRNVLVDLPPSQG